MAYFTTFIALIRSIIYRIIFYVGSTLLVILALFGSFFGQGALQYCVGLWCHYHYWCVRIILGIRVKITGEWPAEKNAFYIIKHESMFETIDMMRILDHPSVIAKAELKNIPLWGPLAERYGMIFIDRKGGAKTLRTMIRTVRNYANQGRPPILFPEGTRVPHGERKKMQSGYAGLYKMIGLPVVPVAVDSGKLMPKGRFIIHSGVITYRFGTLIPTGLSREELEETTQNAINALNS